MATAQPDPHVALRVAQLRRAAREAFIGRMDVEDWQEKWRLDVEFLLSELDRLKEGRLTEEEFQGLCHNLPTTQGPDAVCRFRAGCLDYQCRLFGREAVKAAVAREVQAALELLKSLLSTPHGAGPPSTSVDCHLRPTAADLGLDEASRGADPL